MTGFYMVWDIELKSFDNKVDSFKKKKLKLGKILNSSIEINQPKLFLCTYHIGTVLPVLLSFRKKSVKLQLLRFLS